MVFPLNNTFDVVDNRIVGAQTAIGIAIGFRKLLVAYGDDDGIVRAFGPALQIETILMLHFLRIGQWIDDIHLRARLTQLDSQRSSLGVADVRNIFLESNPLNEDATLADGLALLAQRSRNLL